MQNRSEPAAANASAFVVEAQCVIVSSTCLFPCTPPSCARKHADMFFIECDAHLIADREMLVRMGLHPDGLARIQGHYIFVDIAEKSPVAHFAADARIVVPPQDNILRSH